jgi:hypothetical protein
LRHAPQHRDHVACLDFAQTCLKGRPVCHNISSKSFQVLRTVLVLQTPDPRQIRPEPDNGIPDIMQDIAGDLELTLRDRLIQQDGYLLFQLLLLHLQHTDALRLTGPFPIVIQALDHQHIFAGIQVRIGGHSPGPDVIPTPIESRQHISVSFLLRNGIIEGGKFKGQHRAFIRQGYRVGGRDGPVKR